MSLSLPSFKSLSKHTADHARTLWIPAIALLCFVILAGTGMVAYANSYDQRVLPGVHIGDVPVGGMRPTELNDFLVQITNRLAEEGIMVQFRGDMPIDPVQLLPAVSANGDVREYVFLDIEEAASALLSYGKYDSMWAKTWSTIIARVKQPSLPFPFVELHERAILDDLDAYIADQATVAKNATITLVEAEPITFDVVPAKPGFTFATSHVIQDVRSSWESLTAPVVTVNQTVTDPVITEEMAEQLLPQAYTMTEAGGSFTYTDEQTNRSVSWNILPAELATWIDLAPEGQGAQITLDAVDIEEYLSQEVAPEIEITPRPATFEINDQGKVVEFTGARAGRTIDIESTREALQEVLYARLETSAAEPFALPLVLEVAEAETDLSDTNNLGITEILGVGYSSFAGSPLNRVKNIQNGASKLHGLLIPPGETFSAIDHLRPFTIDAGYLPEKVIKGDEIVPEIGGGLCQIGTTLFRMAMNSGVDIAERRNHSLVVSYYNDPTNGLPGTDATIYEPAPDFKFTNDTENYVLIQAEVDTTNQDLFFTLWGTNDGRKGSYTLPQVSKWIEPGPAKIIETTKLAPGVRECQSAFRGANTSFTYTRSLPNGTTESEVFDSYYRPLPQICLVGVAPEVEEPVMTEEEQAAASEERKERIKELIRQREQQAEAEESTL
jgi:vancomycin resistance protein YoaR